MLVNPYIEPLLGNVTDLTNNPPRTAADVERRWLAWGLLEQPRPADRADLRMVNRYVQEWVDVVDASRERDRVEALNELLRRYTAKPSITDHDGTGWHLHYRDPDASFGATLAGATSAAAAQFLCQRGMHRLGRCQLGGCTNAYVDFSRPGTQRYCCHDCANRDAVRRHRAKKRAPNDSPQRWASTK